MDEPADVPDDAYKRIYDDDNGFSMAPAEPAPEPEQEAEDGPVTLADLRLEIINAMIAAREAEDDAKLAKLASYAEQGDDGLRRLAEEMGLTLVD